jgi:hypothetical protein
MSENRGGIFTAIVQPLVETAADYERLSPQAKILWHASGAAELGSWCLYAAPLFEHRPGTPFEIWAGLSGFCALWLAGAWLVSLGYPRVFGIALKALLFGAGAAALLWFEVYPDGWPVADWLLRGLYLSLLVVSGVRFVVAVQPFQFRGSALGIVDRAIRRDRWDWNARPHRWWMFWRRRGRNAYREI